MSISFVRNYVNDQVIAVDPNLSAFEKDVFGNNDVTTIEARKNYNLIITNFEMVTEAQYFTRIYNCQLDVWSAKGSGVLADYNTLVDTVEAIQENLINTANYVGQGCIYRVEPLAYAAIEEPTNDNTFKVRLEFDIYTQLNLPAV